MTRLTEQQEAFCVYVLRMQNVAWLKRQLRSIMRKLEAEDPSLIS